MRTREKNIILEQVVKVGGSYAFTSTHCNGSVTSGHDTVLNEVINTHVVYERMDDDIGRANPHACLHRRWVRRINPAHRGYIQGGDLGGGSYGVTTGNVPGYGAYERDYMHAEVSDWQVSGPNPTEPPKWWSITGSVSESVLKEDCLEAAKQLKADVLLNIAEANQIWPSVKSLATCLPAMAANWNRLRKVIRTASGGYLAWKFGVSPILSDVMAIDRYLPRMVSDFRRFETSQASRFSRSAELVALYSPPLIQSGLTNSYPRWRVESQGLIKLKPTIRYVLVVRPKPLSYSTDFFRRADFLMRRFASSPASFAWEKVPFSFVVDWFVDLRSTLGALDKMLGFEPYTIQAFTRSFSYRLTTQSFLMRFSPCNGGAIVNEPAGTSDYVHYERNQVPSGMQMPTWRPHFGKNQAAISAALILQQLTKLRAK